MGPGQISLRAAAEEAPDRAALILADEGGSRISYAELAHLVGRETIAPGLVPVVATAELPSVVRMLACSEAGVPMALLHPRWSATEIAAVLALVAAHDPAADPLDGCLAIVFTSGTTRTPRGVVLSCAAMLAAARASEANLGWRDDDRWLLCLPPAHVGGLAVLVRCLVARRTVVLSARFAAAELVRSIDRDRVTLVSLVPTMLARVLDEQPGWHPPAHLRAVLLGGDGAPAALLRRAAERGLPVLTTYGLTETCGQVATQRPGTPPGPGAPPLVGVALRIVQSRIEVRGPATMTAYFPRAAHESPFVGDGWLQTGDLGRIDGEGSLHVFGRWDDRIVTGGATVHPGEVEQALEEHPAIREACVFGIPDAHWGQIVAAVLVAEGEPPLLSEITAFAEQHLAPFRRPRRWHIVDALPRTPSGKLDRPGTSRRFGR